MQTIVRSPSTVFRDRFRSFLILYFLQGLPYGLQTRFLPIYFRMNGMSLSSVGLYRFLLIPWVLKAVWAPFVDRYGDRRMWLTGSLILLAVLCILAAQFPPDHIMTSAIVLFLFNMTTAVQDIALDALVIDLLSPSELAAGNIAQVGGYRAGTLFAGGIFAWLTGRISWGMIFYILAGMYTLGVYVSEFYLPYYPRRPESVAGMENTDPSSSGAVADMENLDPPSSGAVADMENLDPFSSNDDIVLPPPDTACNFFEIIKLNGTIWMLIYLLIYKIGEQGAQNIYPMFLLDNDIDVQTVGFWSGFAGQCVMLFGSILGGLIVTRSMLETLRVQAIMRAISVFFIWLTVMLWDSKSMFIYAFSILSLMSLFFIGGAVTTCTFTLTMQLSQKVPRRCRASHYSLLSTGEVLGKLLISSAVGAIAEYTSYSFVFGLFTFFAGIVIPIIHIAPEAVNIYM